MARCGSAHSSSSYVAATVAALLAFGVATCGAARILVHNKKASTDDFIATRCGTTAYPRLCIDSLSARAGTIQDDPSQLAQTAISVCLDDARSTSAVLSSLSATGGLGVKEAGVVGDCATTMGDSVDKLQKSLEAMGSHGGRKESAALRINDVQTWVSTALTDVTACKEGLEGSSTDGGVNTRIVNVEQLASIALALLNALNSSSP